MADKGNPVEGWAYPDSLPADCRGFSLQREACWDGSVYRVFSYRNEARRRSASVIYDNNTDDYMLQLRIGLTEFCDVNFINRDRAAFESVLDRFLDARLETLDRCLPERTEFLFRDKKILEWAAGFEFPPASNGFALFLSPAESVQVTNGSYLILDYSDFDEASSLRFYYNIFRDDFYAEYLVMGAPQATPRFDAKTLPELAERLRSGLDEATDELRRRLRESVRLRGRSFARND